MDDPPARVNVMSYHHGEAFNWHFDRSEFTTTLLLQAPDASGEFQYRSGLRTPADPNLDGVARLLDGRDPEVRSLTLAAGTLNVFKRRNTAHRTSPVIGPRERLRMYAGMRPPRAMVRRSAAPIRLRLDTLVMRFQT